VDHYTYLPCLGFAMLAGAGLLACRQAAGRQLRNICAILACFDNNGLACMTWRQEGIWRDSETLWKHALALNPGLDEAYNSLGTVVGKRGELNLAVRYYSEALKINPKNAQAHNNIGNILAAQGKFNQASATILKR